MRIKIGKYVLTSGAKDFQVTELYISEGERTKAEELEKDTTYLDSLEGALNNILKRKLLDSDATTLAQLLKELQEHRAELRYLLWNVA